VTWRGSVGGPSRYVLTFFHCIVYFYLLGTVWCKFLMGKNIDEFDEFLSVCQHFPYQNFPLIIFCHLPARQLNVQGVITSIRAHAKFFPVQIRISV